MTTRLLFKLLGLATLAASLAISAASAADEKPAAKDAVFDLKEVSPLDDGAGQSMLGRQYSRCSTKPFKEVKVYPKLKSKQPLYGKLQFGGTPASPGSVTVYFVLDESGEKPAEAKKTDAENERKTDAKNTKEKKAVKRRPVSLKASTYDRLYFDANCDGDLTNDPVLRPMKDPPWRFLPGTINTERTGFELASIGVDYGPGVGVRPFRVFPWFMVEPARKDPVLHFVAATSRTGTIRIGKVEYDATLTQSVLTGRFDRPTTSIRLTPKEPTSLVPSGMQGGGTLKDMRRDGDDFYTMSASPLGDKLTVQLYRGPLGVFKIGPGDRKLKDFSFQGSFRSETTSIHAGPTPVSRSGNTSTFKNISECKLPVGDYTLSSLTIEYGGLQIGMSANPYADGSRRTGRLHVTYGIQIREDKPFVLDFSNKPAVVFVQPPADKSVKLGQTVRFAAALVDPKLDVMIRGLTDPSQMKKQTIRYRQGKEMKEFTFSRALSLDPTITITDSSGKNVAEGVMPFG